MSSAYLAASRIQNTFFVPGGNIPGAGVQLFFYQNLSSTKQTVYKDSGATQPWANPIVLDSGGNLPSGNSVYLAAGATYTAVYAPSNDTDPPVAAYLTLNDLTGVGDPASSGTISEWVPGPTPTFISATSFALQGNQTATFTPSRRIKSLNTAGTIYSTISSAIFGTSTVVSALNDTGTLDSGLSAVSYGLLASQNPSIPAFSSLLTFTRDVSSTGAQTVTSAACQFVPKHAVFFGAVNGTNAMGMGLSDGTLNSGVCDQNQTSTGTYAVISNASISFVPVTGSLASFVVNQFVFGGLTGTWSKSGSPTGTTTIFALVQR